MDQFGNVIPGASFTAASGHDYSTPLPVPGPGGVNDPPSFVTGPNQTVLEDAGPQTVVGWATAISAGPADEAGQTLTFLISHDNGALFSASPAIDPTGTLTYTPAPNASGTATVTVRLRDTGGTANGAWTPVPRKPSRSPSSPSTTRPWPSCR